VARDVQFVGCCSVCPAHRQRLLLPVQRPQQPRQPARRLFHALEQTQAIYLRACRHRKWAHRRWKWVMRAGKARENLPSAKQASANNRLADTCG
jgi:hypothetical protein